MYKRQALAHLALGADVGDGTHVGIAVVVVKGNEVPQFDKADILDVYKRQVKGSLPLTGTSTVLLAGSMRP